MPTTKEDLQAELEKHSDGSQQDPISIDLHGNVAELGLTHIDQYFGPWAVYAPRFSAMLQGLHGFDLRAHVNRVEQRAPDRDRDYRVARDGTIVLSLSGTMTKRGSSLAGGGTVQLRRTLQNAMNDDEVRGILLNIESPGGTVAGTKELADQVARVNSVKPVHVFIEDIGASAAYYVASQASRITANEPAMVGSIGTFMVVYDASKRAEEFGVKAHVIRAGAFKGAGAYGTEITEEQLAEWQSLIDKSNSLFLDAVAKGRDLTLAQVRQLADGRVHLASDAQGLGLIDGVGTASDALIELSAAIDAKTQGDTQMSEKTEPQAATIEEIKAACPGASVEFVLKQLEAKATVSSAQTAFIAEQNAKLAAAEAAAKEADEKAKQADEKAAKAEADAKSKENLPGNDVHQDTGSAGGSDGGSGEWRGENARAAWREKIMELTDRGVDRMEAASIVDRENPGLRESMNAAYKPPEAAQR